VREDVMALDGTRTADLQTSESTEEVGLGSLEDLHKFLFGDQQRKYIVLLSALLSSYIIFILLFGTVKKPQDIVLAVGFSIALIRPILELYNRISQFYKNSFSQIKQIIFALQELRERIENSKDTAASILINATALILFLYGVLNLILRIPYFR
jgi:hypothetical protein